MVTAVAAGGHGSAFLTRAADEFPEPRHPQLLERCSPRHIRLRSLRMSLFFLYLHVAARS